MPPPPPTGAEPSAATPWVVLRIPGEDGDKNDRALLRLIELLPSLPDAAVGVELQRVEASLSGKRRMRLVRAWRTGSHRGWRGAEPVLDGPTVTARTLELAFDRSCLADLSGLAERAERKGDWLEAARAWEMLADGEGAWPAWARMRCAIARARLHPTASEVARHLGQAWAACPGLPEAGLRLAAWWVARGGVHEAEQVAAMAEGVSQPFAAVPQLDGLGTWAVPAHVASWLAPIAPEAARRHATRALTLEPPREIAEKLARIVGNPAVSAQVGE